MLLCLYRTAVNEICVSEEFFTKSNTSFNDSLSFDIILSSPQLHIASYFLLSE